MRLANPIRVALLPLVTLAAPVADNGAAALIQLYQLSRQASDNQMASLPNTIVSTNQTCTKSNIIMRKEWGNLTTAERISYTDAVLCLQSKPALTPTILVPGARSRYDDFVATHINQTVNIHYTGTFLAWHRYYVWIYEQALRNECGYTGSQPYWNWGLYSSDPAASPVFDGSATSMSGNGENNGDCRSTRDPSHLSPHTRLRVRGRGCVETGPFKNMTVNLGPVPLPFSGQTKINGTGFVYNPRCLQRDINATINQNFANANCIVNLINGNQDIWNFEMTMQGFPGSPIMGVHKGGHYTIGGEPASDPFASPGDPAFYVHHAMIDKVWWIWQNLDPVARTNAISGTATLLNLPQSPNTTLDTLVDVGYAGGSSIAMRELMDTASGPFCYTYG